MKKGSPPSVSTELWTRWLKTRERLGTQTVLIDANFDRAYSANELHEEAMAFSYRLATCTSGDRIAFRLCNGMHFMACFLALQKNGVTAIPLDPGMPMEGCQEIAKLVSARLLYYDDTLHAVNLMVQNKPGIACMKLTSGSDGAVKSVACQAKHLIADGENIIRTMDLKPEDRNLAAIPLGHSYGLGNLVMPLILQGTTMVCVSAYTPRQLLDWMEHYRVTVFPGVPALFRVLAALPDVNLTTLRKVISAGAALSPEVAESFSKTFGQPIHNFYGSSETGGICYDRTGTASLTGRSVGKPLHGVKVKVEKNRISVASKAVAAPTGTWQTEDHGHWNDEGELVLIGRGSSNANIGGKKVHPLEIEKILRSLPGVIDATVWLHKYEGRDTLAAAVETVRSQAWLEHNLSRKLPAWKVPRWYVVSKKLPRNVRGKLDMAVLKKRIALKEK